VYEVLRIMMDLSEAEIIQGTLQTIFEYQTMIANIIGMDNANASMYDSVIV